MTLGGSSAEQAAAVWQRAARARERADRELRLVRECEDLARERGGDLHVRLAHIHQASARRHELTAQLLESHARRAARWADTGGRPPLFMTGVAEACGADSAAVTLVDIDRNQIAAASSDEPSRAAQELEYILGEGPARDAVRNRCAVVASGGVLAGRWPGYGPAAEGLGIGHVLAVPLQSADSCIGALAAFGVRSDAASTTTVTQVADSLTRNVFLGADAVPGLFGGIDYRAEVHQAAGMVAVQLGCRIPDALELVKVRAFADSRPIGDIAQDIVQGRLRLG
ncbi:GAF and ANTAR domain-containing protein [Streptomyces endophyticus]|uniref:GAF and ANTAR domain-containing protein n=1 Tax=Streptomyces endophyticus TaxID=714166 RepID=A0ABU6FK79_9ACTN|nr:GAF and ANTAR domain-containing protein [Streptomyces endophyticus]MEB8343197.1 GAF and ANTAR domain-containing protein [Streptomyces endophyticus]